MEEQERWQMSSARTWRDQEEAAMSEAHVTPQTGLVFSGRRSRSALPGCCGEVAVGPNGSQIRAVWWWRYKLG